MNASRYKPPLTLTPAIVTQVAEIAETVGRVAARLEDAGGLRLRRANRIRTIHGSLAIEGNTLSEAQITAILEGKRVLAPPREVREVRNALATYDQLPDWQPTSRVDLLAAHRSLMKGLAEDAGRWRSGGVGVMAGTRVVHMGPPADRVPTLMEQLLHWLAGTDLHPLIASSVFHYEFEFIHPFSDGNGRMGRLWQTLILTRWHPLFTDMPVESLVHLHQEDYYRAIRESTRQGDAAPFVDFMLEMIFDALAETGGVNQQGDQVRDQVSDQVVALLGVLRGEMGSAALMQALGLSHRTSFRRNYLDPALEGGWIERTQPDSPRSPTQRYRLSERGREWLRQHGDAG